MTNSTDGPGYRPNNVGRRRVSHKPPPTEAYVAGGRFLVAPEAAFLAFRGFNKSMISPI